MVLLSPQDGGQSSQQEVMEGILSAEEEEKKAEESLPSDETGRCVKGGKGSTQIRL